MEIVMLTVQKFLLPFPSLEITPFKGLLKIFILVPTSLEGRGGEELYTHEFFFVQSILVDRYIHRRELRLVSLESLSSVEYGIKKIFLISVFYREISRFKLSRK